MRSPKKIPGARNFSHDGIEQPPLLQHKSPLLLCAGANESYDNE
jgi:hypothetical protein